MKTVKSEQEMLTIIENQEQQIRILRRAISHLEQRVNRLARNATNTQQTQRNLQEQVRNIATTIKVRTY